MLLILQERSRRLSSFSLRGEDTQPDFHSEEFERSLEAGSKWSIHIFTISCLTSNLLCIQGSHHQHLLNFSCLYCEWATNTLLASASTFRSCFLHASTAVSQVNQDRCSRITESNWNLLTNISRMMQPTKFMELNATSSSVPTSLDVLPPFKLTDIY